MKKGKLPLCPPPLNMPLSRVKVFFLLTYGQSDKPEPNDDVDLLVDDVEREDALPIRVLDCSGATVPAEVTFCYLKYNGRS